MRVLGWMAIISGTPAGSAAPITFLSVNAIPTVPSPINEPVLSYAPGTPERVELKRTLKDLAARPLEIPLVIGGREVRTGKTIDPVMPPCPHHPPPPAHHPSPTDLRP